MGLGSSRRFNGYVILTLRVEKKYNMLDMLGAFGIFGPSQFNEFFAALTRPAARNCLYFAGEAISTTHG